MERSADWIAQARRDLAHARADIDGSFYDWACFSAQQAAEKALKAVLFRLGAEPWGHTVAGLLAGLPDKSPELSELMLDALELDKVYVTSRYPDALPSGSPGTQYTIREAERLEGYARAIVEFCESRLSDADQG